MVCVAWRMVAGIGGRQKRTYNFDNLTLDTAIHVPA